MLLLFHIDMHLKRYLSLYILEQGYVHFNTMLLIIENAELENTIIFTCTHEHEHWTYLSMSTIYVALQNYISALVNINLSFGWALTYSAWI